ncbi:MAG: relaxase/mobilization nuclease domain-containing protein [Lachnospiraceae bacterium]|nr:relaxase/mobilization nuclease domain-containing protein [Lachnospiraceae bacterium]
MAYTRIHAVKATVQKALKYICNPEKTDGKLLIDSFACGVETAHYDFMDALSKSSGVGDKQAFHLIQSFAPGEVDFDTAHQVGIELADKLLENKYSYVIATHIDKEHCHNHIIFCAVDNVEHKKYNDCKRTYRRIRNLSDELCREHGLSVIIPSGQKGKTHYEWQEQKKGQSWKSQMKSDMDDAICKASSFDDFICRMRSKGYAVKGETFGDDALKYLSFSASGQNRFTRVSVKNFGEGYTKEVIRERIEQRVKAQGYSAVRKRVPLPKRPDAKRTLIDTDKEKFQESGALKHWADIQNLKIAAASYAEGGSIEELQQRIAERSVVAKTARNEMVELEHEMKNKAEILKYAKQYMANRKYQRGYEKAKDQDTYFRSHETQIILFGGAENMLKRYGVKISSLDVEKIQAEYDAMTVQKAKLKKTYQTAEKEAAEAGKQLKNIRQYLGVEKDGHRETKQHRKQDVSL